MLTLLCCRWKEGHLKPVDHYVLFERLLHRSSHERWSLVPHLALSKPTDHKAATHSGLAWHHVEEQTFGFHPHHHPHHLVQCLHGSEKLPCAIFEDERCTDKPFGFATSRSCKYV